MIANRSIVLCLVAFTAIICIGSLGVEGQRPVVMPSLQPQTPKTVSPPIRTNRQPTTNIPKPNAPAPNLGTNPPSTTSPVTVNQLTDGKAALKKTVAPKQAPLLKAIVSELSPQAYSSLLTRADSLAQCYTLQHRGRSRNGDPNIDSGFVMPSITQLLVPDTGAAARVKSLEDEKIRLRQTKDDSPTVTAKNELVQLHLIYERMLAEARASKPLCAAAQAFLDALVNEPAQTQLDFSAATLPLRSSTPIRSRPGARECPKFTFSESILSTLSNQLRSFRLPDLALDEAQTIADFERQEAKLGLNQPKATISTNPSTGRSTRVNSPENSRQRTGQQRQRTTREKAN